MEDDSTYIRGGSVASADPRRVWRVVLIGAVVAVIVLVAVLLVDAVRQSSREDRLRIHGMRVAVTVTSCQAIASGTGVTQSGFTCWGTFDVDGQQHNEAIRGVNDVHQTGEVLPSVVLRDDPSSVTLATALAASGSGWEPFATPLALLAALVVGLVVLLVRRRALAQS